MEIKTMFTSELGEIMADLEKHKDKPLIDQEQENMISQKWFSTV